MCKVRFVSTIVCTLGLLAVACMAALPLQVRVSAKELSGPPDAIVGTGIEEVIDSYFELRYKALKTLDLADFSPLTAATDDFTTRGWLQRERDRQEIELFIARTFGTSYHQYEFFLDYQSVEIDGSEATVKLSESNKVFYTTNPTLPSGMANLEHVITLRNLGGTWKISDDQYRDEIIDLLENSAKADILQTIQRNREAQFSQPTIEGQPMQIESTHSYNRTLAADYADEWWDGINDIYHDAGADCTNYASQAVYEGTNHTMSTPPGSDKWYYNFTAHTGSTPWVNVGGLYTFLTTNSGRGPYGYSSGAYTCNLSKGDVITMKQSGTWHHTVVVSTIVGDCHIPSNILVDAHDTDYLRQPLSWYSGYTWYTLTVSGYRD